MFSIEILDIPLWLILLLVCLILLVYYTSYNHGLFKRCGIFGPTPLPVIGNSWFMFSLGFPGSTEEGYHRYGHHGMYGLYEGNTPVLNIADPDLLKEVMIKRFDEFPNRPTYAAFDTPLMERTLFNLKDPKWRTQRKLLRPSMSFSRIKESYPSIEKILREMLNEMERLAVKGGGEVDMMNPIFCFITDVLAKLGFDAESDAVTNPNNDFNVATRYVLNEFSDWTFIFLLFVPPFLKTILDNMGFTILPKKELIFFREHAQKAMEKRQFTPSDGQERGDMFQYMVDNSTLREDIRVKNEDGTERKKVLSVEDIHGICLTYFLAGYDAAAKAHLFCLYNIAMHPEIYKRAQKEVDEVLQGEFPNPYNVTKLKYLEMCILESHRKNPLGIMTERINLRDTTLGGKPIPAGITLRIPIAGIHKDHKVYPDPERYDPERFTPENRKGRHPMSFLPFGAGPRGCFGSSLAQLMMRTCMASVLQRFDLTPTSRSEYPIRVLPLSDLVPAHPFWLQLSVRKPYQAPSEATQPSS